MRLLVRVRAAISSMRAPAKPLLANSCVATSMMLSAVASGSLVRVVEAPRLGLAEEADAVGADWVMARTGFDLVDLIVN